MAPLPDPIDTHAIFRVGTVVGVEGRKVRIRVDRTKNGSHLLFRGQTLKNVSVGSFVKIAKGFSEIIAKVDGESIQEPRFSPSAYRSRDDEMERFLDVSIVGFFRPSGRFARGVQEMPLLNNECSLLSHGELERVHRFVSDDDTPLVIGTLPMERDYPISIGINATFASHIGIFGNTGSGKSYTLSKLYFELLRMYQGHDGFDRTSRIVLIDFNGEYLNLPPSDSDATSTSVISQKKKVYQLSTKGSGGDKIPVSEEDLEDPEFWKVLLDATEKTQAPFLVRALRRGYLDDKLDDSASLKAEVAQRFWDAVMVSASPDDAASLDALLTEICTLLSDQSRPVFESFVRRLRSRLSYHTSGRSFYYIDDDQVRKFSDNPQHQSTFAGLRTEILGMPLEFELSRETRKVRFKILMRYYFEIFNGYANREHVGPLMKRLEARIGDIDKVIEVAQDVNLLPESFTVISLRDVNLDMKKTLPLLLCKNLYNEQKLRGEPGHYLNLVIDEAHTILSKTSNRESETWKDYRLETFEEIIKEGRKFNVFLTIASQRPHDISDTIISQLHNYFVHRLVNELDIHAIRNTVGFLDRVSFDQIPILPTGSCILAGVGSQVPVVVSISPLPIEYEPNSKTTELTRGWTS